MLHQAYGVDLMDIAAGGHLDSTTTSWLGERAQTLRSTVSSAATAFFDQARTLYQMISTSTAVQALRNLTTKVDNGWTNHGIHALTSMSELQTAGPIMQRYIMAEPTVRELYLNNSVEGYGDSYTNVWGDNVGIKHYDWRRVMDEIVIVNDDHSIVHQFYEEIPDGDKELDLHEKVDILRTWNSLNCALSEAEIDPTSPIGNLLG